MGLERPGDLGLRGDRADGGRRRSCQQLVVGVGCSRSMCRSAWPPSPSALSGRCPVTVGSNAQVRLDLGGPQRGHLRLPDHLGVAESMARERAWPSSLSKLAVEVASDRRRACSPGGSSAAERRWCCPSTCCACSIFRPVDLPPRMRRLHRPDDGLRGPALLFPEPVMGAHRRGDRPAHDPLAAGEWGSPPRSSPGRLRRPASGPGPLGYHRA